MGGEDGRLVGDVVALLAERLDDDLPLVLVARADQVADVLQQDDLRVVRLDDRGDVEEQGAARLVHAALGAGLGERLAGEACAQHVVRRERS